MVECGAGTGPGRSDKVGERTPTLHLGFAAEPVTKKVFKHSTQYHVVAENNIPTHNLFRGHSLVVPFQ